MILANPTFSGSINISGSLNLNGTGIGATATSASVATIAERVRAGSTGSRPTVTQSGSLWYNTNTSNLEVYTAVSGSQWEVVGKQTGPDVPAIAMSGGTVTSFTSGSTDLTIHAFTSTGVLTVTTGGIIDILLVGGGGAGAAAGAGAGGVIFDRNVTLAAGSYTITIGAGGASHNAFGTNTVAPNHGGNTSTDIPLTSTANGGQGAIGWDYQPSTTMNTWGSGAGVGQSSTSGFAVSGYTTGQGNPGGMDGSDVNPYPSGGGGGAGAAGGAGSGNQSGVGGAGRDMALHFGTTYGENGVFAGGGAGANHASPFNNATGGSGGGGNYTIGTFSGRSALVNTGGGGSAGANPTHENYPAGAGGTGIVLIRFIN